MNESHPLDRLSTKSAQVYAKATGTLLLVSIVAGGFGEFFVPNQLIVSGDATATAQNIIASRSLFRLGFASYLVEALCDVALSLCFYVLLKPVHKELALLAAFFGLVSTAVFACAELFYFAASVILDSADYLKTFSQDQVHSLAMLSVRLYGNGAGVFMAFYGLAAILRGILIFRSRYLPRFLGVLLLLGGVGFIVRNFVLLLAPQHVSDWLLLPTPIAMVTLTLWLLIKGIDVAKWREGV